MTAALRISASGAPVERIEFDPHAVDTWGALVGDPSGVDFITVREQGIQFVVGDTSILRDAPHNRRARWYLRGTGRWNIGPVRGDVLIIGVDQAGESADVPAPLLGLADTF